MQVYMYFYLISKNALCEWLTRKENSSTLLLVPNTRSVLPMLDYESFSSEILLVTTSLVEAIPLLASLPFAAIDAVRTIRTPALCYHGEDNQCQHDDEDEHANFSLSV